MGGRRRAKDGARGSDDSLAAETEEEGWGHAPLMTLPWGTQESGARGLQVNAQACRSDGQKAPSATADEVGT